VLAARYDETIPLTTDDEDEGEPEAEHPLFLVFEPDLLDNYGLSHGDNAVWAAEFFRRIGEPQGGSPSTSPSTVWAASPIC
jgi:hypothetical protein